LAKRILVYTNHFYPEQFKINEIVDWISTKDYEVRLITCIPNYPEGKFFEGYGLRSIKSNYHKNNVIVNRLPLIPRGNGNFFLRILNYTSYFISTFLFTLYLILFKKKYDYVFVHHTSPILIAIHPIFYGIFYNSKKILWDLDIWPDTLKALKIIKTPIMYKALESIVSYIYSFYDKILIGSEGFEEIIKKRYKKEIIYFPNWAEVEIEQNSIDFKSELKLSKENFTIMYTGNIGHAQGFDRIAKTINILSKYKIYWIFIGGGSFKAEFVKLLKDYKVFKKCLMIDQINISKIPSYVYHADALLLSLNNDFIFTKTVPAKLQSYLALGKPVIASISGEGAKVIKKSKSGIVEDTSDFVKLADMILKFSKLNKKELIEIGVNGKVYYDRNFSIKLRKKQLLDLFK
tara:strand:+ start:659 stop:1870 length:1212 start_codon:yes stop_codon:yes gene_type:complete